MVVSGRTRDVNTRKVHGIIIVTAILFPIPGQVRPS